jgi:hypothetical protein
VFTSGNKVISELYRCCHYFLSDPCNIKDQAYEIKTFRPAVKRFLFLNLFYSLDEYYNYDTN